MKYSDDILLVAKFTGISPIKGGDYYYYNNAEMQDYEALPFYDNWNEIMPIVIKIKKMQHDPKETFMRTTFEQKLMFDSVTTLPIYTPIETIFETIVKFVKWYNSTQK